MESARPAIAAASARLPRIARKASTAAQMSLEAARPAATSFVATLNARSVQTHMGTTIVRQGFCISMQD